MLQQQYSFYAGENISGELTKPNFGRGRDILVQI